MPEKRATGTSTKHRSENWSPRENTKSRVKTARRGDGGRKSSGEEADRSAGKKSRGCKCRGLACSVLGGKKPERLGRNQRGL